MVSCLKRKLYPVVVGCSTAIFFAFTKWVRVFHNAILKCSKTDFAGISQARRLVFQRFHGLGEQTGESRIFFK